MEIPTWRVSASEVVIDNRFMRVRKDTVVLPNGTVIPDYYVRESRGFVVVFALTPDDDVILVRQFKYGAGKIVLELPAGMIDPGESALACAVREFGEETGYRAEIEHVRSFPTDPTNSNNLMHLYVGRNAHHAHAQKFDPAEEIEVELAPRSHLRKLIATGAIEVAPHVASILFMLDWLEK